MLRRIHWAAPALVGSLWLTGLSANAQEPAPPTTTSPPPARTVTTQRDWVLTPSDPLPSARESPISDVLEPRRERRQEIETDRDSFTPATSIAERGRLILESAYSFIDNRRVAETHSLPELLLRYGLTDWLEVRLGWNYEVGGAPSSISTTSSGGELEGGSGLERSTTLSYGFKVLLTEQDGCLPASVFFLQGFTPTSGEATATQVVATSAYGWELPNRWKFDTALRYSTGSERGDHFDVSAPSVVVKAPVGEKVNVHVEYFGLFSRDKEQDFVKHFISPGVHYLVTPNLEVGVRVGWGLNDQSARFFSNAGVGWQF